MKIWGANGSIRVIIFSLIYFIAAFLFQYYSGLVLFGERGWDGGGVEGGLAVVNVCIYTTLVFTFFPYVFFHYIDGFRHHFRSISPLPGSVFCFVAPSLDFPLCPMLFLSVPTSPVCDCVVPFQLLPGCVLFEFVV